jgi:hypothetical protein
MSGEKPKELALIGKSERTNLTREDFFKFISKDIDSYNDIKFTPEEELKIHQQLRAMSTGSVSMLPLVCKGPQCPWASRCMFQQIGKAPINKQCLIEINLLKEWRMVYFDEYSVDANSFTEITIINELAEIEVLLWRVNMSLSQAENAGLTQEASVGVDRQGNPIYQQQVSVHLDVRDRLLNRKSKLIKMMVGDRQEQYKKEAALKRREEKDPSQSQSDLRRKIEEMQRDFDKKRQVLEQTSGVIDAEFKEKKILTPDDLLSEDLEGVA